jgi:preprotein translocase subunit SecF
MFLDTLKKIQWKKLFTNQVLLAILIAGGAFFAGRYTVSTKIVETTKTIETRHELQTIEQKVNLTELKQIVATSQKESNKTRDVVYITRPDGTKIVKEHEEAKVNASTSTQTQTKVAKTETVDVKSQVDTIKTEEKTHIVEKLVAPKWDLAIQGGVSLPGLVGGTAPKSYLPIGSNLVVGAVVERKVIGNLKIGAWANSHLDAGLQLSYGF